MEMKEFDFDYAQKSLPYDIALQIASSLQASDLASLGCCSRSWREICKSDCLWEPLSKQRWPSSSSSSTHDLGWRAFYVETHNFMARKAAEVVRFVEESAEVGMGSIEAVNYREAVRVLYAAQLGIEDIEMLLFKPRLHLLLILVVLQCYISLMDVSAESVREALQRCKISDRRVCLKWRKRGTLFYGVRMKDESHSCEVTLAGLATAEVEELLWVLWNDRDLLRVQISDADPSGNPWYCPTTQTQE